LAHRLLRVVKSKVNRNSHENCAWKCCVAASIDNVS
jgi:hypothetical protein